jgi:hypothetical protein
MAMNKIIKRKLTATGLAIVASILVYFGVQGTLANAGQLINPVMLLVGLGLFGYVYLEYCRKEKW